MLKSELFPEVRWLAQLIRLLNAVLGLSIDISGKDLILVKHLELYFLFSEWPISVV